MDMMEVHRCDRPCGAGAQERYHLEAVIHMDPIDSSEPPRPLPSGTRWRSWPGRLTLRSRFTTSGDPPARC